MAGERYINNLLDVGLRIEAPAMDLFKKIQKDVIAGKIPSIKYNIDDFSETKYINYEWREVGKAKNYRSIWEASSKFILSLVEDSIKRVIYTFPTKSHKKGRIFLPKVIFKIEHNLIALNKSINEISLSKEEIETLQKFFFLPKLADFLDKKKWVEDADRIEKSL
jgi:hypothetical protein